MSDDQHKKDGADGWVDDVDPFARTEFGLESIDGPPQAPPQVPSPPSYPPQPGAPSHPPAPTQMAPPQQYAPTEKNPYDIEQGKAMAFVAHAGIIIGLPTCIIPMMQRDNEFALHHAKAAAVNYMFFLVAIMGVIFIALITCGIGAVIAPVIYIPMIVGMVNVANGERASGWAFGNIGESIFSGMQIKDEYRKRLPE